MVKIPIRSSNFWQHNSSHHVEGYMKNWVFLSQLGFGIEVIDKKVVDAGASVYTQTLKFLEFVRIQGSEASGDHPFMIRIY